MEKHLDCLNALLTTLDEGSEMRKAVATAICIIDGGIEDMVSNLMYLEEGDNVYNSREYLLKEDDYKMVGDEVVLEEDFKERVLSEMEPGFDITHYFFRQYKRTRRMSEHNEYLGDIKN